MQKGLLWCNKQYIFLENIKLVNNSVQCYMCQSFYRQENNSKHSSLVINNNNKVSLVHSSAQISIHSLSLHNFSLNHLSLQLLSLFQWFSFSFSLHDQLLLHVSWCFLYAVEFPPHDFWQILDDGHAMLLTVLVAKKCKNVLFYAVVNVL